jgi:hypothetical protein
MPLPAILVVAPPSLGVPAGAMEVKFQGAQAKCEGMAQAYEQVCLELGCNFFDESAVVKVSQYDGVHLDATDHQTLGLAIARRIRSELQG